jgi:Uma2 family endonuclease
MATSEELRVATVARGLIRHHRLSAAQYRRMGETGILTRADRVELIDGEVIDMSPAGSRHAGVVRQLAQLLEHASAREALVSVQNPLSLGDASEPEPDIVLLRPRDDYYKNAHPRAADSLLVIEVADTSLRFDRLIKLPLYARHEIAEVWLVDLDHDRVTSYCEPRDGRYGVVEEIHVHAAAPAALPRAKIDLAAVLAK